MKRSIFIIHGSYGNPKENWFPWLKKELEQLGNKVFVPQFPIPTEKTPGGHQLGDWLKKFDEYRKYVDKNTIIVGHSRGAVFCYHLLPTLTKQIDSVFLVGGWLNYHWTPKGSLMITSFHQRPFYWDKIKKSALYKEVYQSSNDPDIPIWEGRDVAKKIGAKCILVKNAGHFNVAIDPTFTKFPLLLANIKKRL